MLQLSTKKLSADLKGFLSQSYLVYEPNEMELVVVAETFNLFRDTAENRDAPFEYFDKRTLVDMINENVEAFVTNIFETEFQEDWQATIHDPFTRNKVIAVLSKVVEALPVVEYYGRGDEDRRRGQILTDIVDYTNELDNYEELLTFALLEGLVKGTFIGYEGYEESKKKIRHVKESFGVPKTVTETEETRRKFYGSVIPLEDFYPSSVGIRKIKDMPYCFWRTVMDYSQFMLKFGYLDRAQYVCPKFQTDSKVRPFYYDYMSSDVGPGQVELLRRYDQEKDRYVIQANGIWLNPTTNWEVEPLPWEHKGLPFWSFIYEPLGADFFYGKSFADKMSSLQKALDVLHNMLLDQSFLSIFAPIIIAGGVDVIEDDFLRPGRRIPIDTGGLPVSQMFSKLDVGVPGSWHQYILEFTKRIMEETSIDTTSQGMVQKGGERTTATEVRTAAAGVVQLIGLFARFIKTGLIGKARLRGSNVLQFIHLPMVEQVLGEGASKEFKKAFNVFKIEDTVLSSGKRGMRVIEMYKNPEQLPNRGQLKLEKAIMEKQTGTRVEKLAILPEYLRNWEFDMRLVVNVKLDTNKDLERAFEISFQTTMNQLYPDLIDREELATELIEKFNKRPEKVLRKDILEKPPVPVVPSATNAAGGAGALSQNIIQKGVGVMP